MGKKYNNLNMYSRKGINVHDYHEYSEVEELLEYAKDNDKFSIRFDRDKDYYGLPFYTYEKENYKDNREEYFTKIVEEAKSKKCTLLVSNGHKYDEKEICNFVITISKNGDFTLEWSTKKVTLREMYAYKTTCLMGNVSSEFKDMKWIRKDANPLDISYVEKIISWACNLNIYDKSIEATLYPMNVGVNNERIVCWQID